MMAYLVLNCRCELEENALLKRIIMRNMMINSSRQFELSTLTTLDVQRNVAAAVNSRRKMKWAIGVERNGMVSDLEDVN